MHRLNRRWALVLVAFLSIQSFSDISQSHAQSSGALDIASITLRPDDIAQTGWVHDGAFTEHLESEAENQAAYLGRGTTSATVASQLTSFGWQRMYVAVLSLPSSNPNMPFERIRSYVTDYATEDGAMAGFAYLEDEGTVVSAKDVPAARTYGDASELTSDRGVSALDGRTYRSLDLTFRLGTRVAGVTLTVYPSKTAMTPDQTLVETLGALLEARVMHPALEGAGLGRAVARLNLPTTTVISYDDAYYRLGGTDIPISGETAMATAQRVRTYQEASDVYQLWQGVDVGSPSGFLYGVTLLHFPDASAAERWVTSLQTILEENPFYRDMRPVSDLDAMGDQALGLSYAAGGGADTPRSILIAVRVGSDVARVHLVPQGRIQDIPLAPALFVAKAEVSCLQSQACADLGEIPAGMAVAAPAATPIASLAASPAV